MKTKFNRFALIPFHCTDCHRYVWLEKYRKADVETNIPDHVFVKKKICDECLKKYNVRGE